MNIQTLIEELQAIVEQDGEDVEVRLAFQPRYPLEYSLSVISDTSVKLDKGPLVVWLGEGRQIGYLPEAGSLSLGWSESPEDDEDED